LGCSEPPPPVDPVAGPWIKQLETGNPQLREEAIAKLAALDSPAVVAPLLNTAQFDNQRQLRVAALRALTKPKLIADPAPLIGLLRDREAEIRAVTCETLGQLQAVAAVDALAECLRDPQPIVRIAAVHALGRLGAPGVARVDQLLKGGRVEDRVTIVEVAGNAGDKTRLPTVIAALQDDNDTMRRAAAEALGKLKDPSAIEPLLALARNPLSEATVASIQARTNQAPTSADRNVMVQILDESQLAAGRTAGGMKEHGWVMTTPPAKLTGLFQQVVDRQKLTTANAVRHVVAEALNNISPPSLSELLADPDPAVSEVACRVIIKSRKSLDPLYTLLADAKRPAAARLRALDLILADIERPDEVVSNDTLLQAFEGKSNDPILLPLPGGRKAPRTVPLGDQLTGILKSGLNDPHTGVRLRFARELAQRRVPEAAEALVGMLSVTNQTVLLPAIQALALYQDARPVPRLLELLQNADATSLHGAVIAALGASRDPRATEALLALVDSPRQADALRALAAVGDPKAGKALFEKFQKSGGSNRDLWLAAIAACKVTEAVPVFIAELNTAGKNDDALLSALGELRDARAYEAILKGISRGTYHPRAHDNRLARIGIEALVKIGDLRAVPFLEGLVRQSPDPVTREYAADGLGKFARPEAVDALVRLLGDTTLDRGIKEVCVGPAFAALGSVAKPQLIKLLVESPAPGTDKQFDLGIYAAQLLAAMGPAALPELQQAVNGAPKHVLARITEATGKIADDRAVEILATVAKHNDPLVRQWAVVALGRSRQESAVKVLRLALNDSNPEVSRWTRWGLEQHGVKQP
jgi:HEAT repeat protein